MAKIFISYGSNDFQKSLARIGKEAQLTGVFDKILLYAENDLPEFIRLSPVFNFRRGGGYWMWKAYIIKQTLSDMKEGDILCYADAGCTLNKNVLWNEYLNYLNNFNALFFQYKNVDYGWSRFSKYDYPKLKYWIKGSAIEVLKSNFKDDEWLDFNKIMAGFLFVKKTKNTCNIIDQWYKLTINNPEILVDSHELNEIETNVLLNEHRHDQAILTAMVYLYKELDQVLVIPESFELVKNGPIFISRKNDFQLEVNKNWLKSKAIGGYSRLKSFLKH